MFQENLWNYSQKGNSPARKHYFPALPIALTANLARKSFLFGVCVCFLFLFAVCVCVCSLVWGGRVLINQTKQKMKIMKIRPQKIKKGWGGELKYLHHCRHHRKHMFTGFPKRCSNPPLNNNNNNKNKNTLFTLKADRPEVGESCKFKSVLFQIGPTT